MKNKINEFLEEVMHGPCASAPLSEYVKYISAEAAKLLHDKQKEETK